MDESRGGLREGIEALFAQQVEGLTATEEFCALATGRAAPEQYDAFIENVACAHLRSPQLLAFLYALAPPPAATDLLHNLLEELGLDDAAGRAHPDLLKDLVAGAGLSHRLPHLEAEANEELRRAVVEPLLYGSLHAVGLAALTEIVAFEYMLARVSRCFARALAEHRGVPAHALTWFTHHSEVDIRHAEQGLADLEAYARYYDFTTDEALTIAGMALRENVFARRYFRDFVPPAEGRR